MKSSTTRWILRGAFAAAALAGAAFVAARFALPPTVDVVQPRRGPAVQAVYATGTVEPSVMLPIAPRISARLVELASDEGRTVRKGDVLGRLEDTDLRNVLAQLRTAEALARRDYERSAALSRTGVIARSEYDRASSAWRAAQAASAKAAAELDYARLVAPADGRVIHRDGEVGQLIAANQAVFWLAVDSPPRVAAEVDEEDIARVAVGQMVLIRADAFPERTFDGHVQSITPKGDPVARSYRVRIAFDQETPLQIGMTAETNIVIRSEPNALLLPPAAVRQNQVWRVADGRVEPRSVTIGANGAQAVEIVRGVEPGDTLLAAPDGTLRAGARVRVRGSDPAP